ncbi:TPA: DUF1398 domain-containing protein, partial [Listeria monocytogenes]|nr:DUF1398 domain-containing protein [Listeria monocytogenes]HEM2161191.1 DUF1398 domain-containing protein [Listeria monocytogenes]HEM2347970.1 DUF1398 domain-containing protein [Listeria monocytogenes]
LSAMKVTYIDNTGNDLIVEPIPSI